MATPGPPLPVLSGPAGCTVPVMALAPVFCDNPTCGTVWATTSMIGGDAAHITMTGNKVAPCPACGGVGSVPDGVYNLVDDTLQVVSTATQGLSADALQRLIESLRKAASSGESAQSFAQRVEAEAPDLAPVVQVLVQQSGGQNWQQWTVLVLTLLTVLLGYAQWQHPQQPPEASSPATAEQIANEVLQELEQHPVKPPAEREGEMNKHTNETIRITDLATTNPVVSDHEFSNCVISGPAVIAPIQQTTISNCALGGPPDEILWPTPPSQSGRVVGAVGLVNCTFEGCRFEGIGFTGPPEFLDQMRTNLLGPHP